MRKILSIFAVIVFVAAIGVIIAMSIQVDRAPSGFADAQNTVAPPHTTAPDTSAADTTVDSTTVDTTTDTIDTSESISSATTDTVPEETLPEDSESTDTTSESTLPEETTVIEETTVSDETTIPEEVPPAEETTAPLVPPPTDFAFPNDNTASKIDEFFKTLDSTEVLLSVGYSVSDKPYGENTRLSLLTRGITDSIKFTLRPEIVKTPVRIPDEIYGTYTTELRDTAVNRPLVSIYMDYIFVDNGDSFKVYTNAGNMIYEQFNADEFVPLYTRDILNRPLFGREEQSKWNPNATVTKYYYLDEIGALLESDYNDKTDNRGLYANYPSYYGVSDNNLVKSYSAAEGLYTYAFSDGTKTSPPAYKNAYNFSEGYAAYVDEYGVMNFTDSALRRNIFGYDWSEWYYHHGRRVRPLIVEPDTNGIESLGFFYFENGLCRVRRQIVDSYNWEHDKTKLIASDSDILIRTDGTEFPIPTDYTVAAYSCGMILLEKDGYYGFMDTKGRWVVQPIYTHAEPFSEGLTVIGKDNKMGVIDTAGNFVVPMLFDHIERPSGGIITLYDVQHGWAVMNKCYYPPSDQITE